MTDSVFARRVYKDRPMYLWLANDLLNEYPQFFGRSSMDWETLTKIAEFSVNRMVLHDWLNQVDQQRNDQIPGQMKLFDSLYSGQYYYPEGVQE